LGVQVKRLGVQVTRNQFKRSFIFDFNTPGRRVVAFPATNDPRYGGVR
jgi:hypothetical protein